MNNKFYAQAEIFVAVIRYRSITQAARELKTTKSNVSQKLSDLEASLNVKLLDRTTRSMTLTPAGEQAYRACFNAVNATAKAAAEVGIALDRASTLSGRVRLSGSNTYLTKIVLPAISAFLDDYPHIELSLLGSDRRVDFAAEDVDLGFRIGPINATQDIVTALDPLQRVLCASPALLADFGPLAHPADLAPWPCIVRAQERPVWALQCAASLHRHTIATPRLTIDTIEMSQQAAVEGLGLALLPAVIVADDLRQGRLMHVLPDWAVPPIPVSLVTRQTRISKNQVGALYHFLVTKLRSEDQP